MTLSGGSWGPTSGDRQLLVPFTNSVWLVPGPGLGTFLGTQERVQHRNYFVNWETSSVAKDLIFYLYVEL